MKSIEIKSKNRENTGKSNTNLLRREGNVPCVLYGGNEVVHFSATQIGFKDLVYTAAAHTVVLNFGDKKVNAILQDIQFHPVTDKILHADFYELFDDKPVTMEIPVILSGSAPGVINSGGVLRGAQGGGVLDSAVVTKGISLFMNSGNITAGNFKLYGLKK